MLLKYIKALTLEGQAPKLQIVIDQILNKS